MGGSKNLFDTTCWTAIHHAQTMNREHKILYANELTKKYWKPIYCFLRKKGYDNDTAKDITQGFFLEVVFSKDLVRKADQGKGRFRTYLLTALERYAIDAFRKENTLKRTPQNRLIPLQTDEVADLVENTYQLTAQQVYQYMWASQVIGHVLEEVKTACTNKGEVLYWELFYAKVVAPILNGTPAISISEFCVKNHIDDEKQASNMIVTVKRRFRSSMFKYLRQFVCSDQEVEEEFNDIFKFLSRANAGSA
jgi:RNA polymerase sigma-70 factor (ECF subfamily)